MRMPGSSGRCRSAAASRDRARPCRRRAPRLRALHRLCGRGIGCRIVLRCGLLDTDHFRAGRVLRCRHRRVTEADPAGRPPSRPVSGEDDGTPSSSFSPDLGSMSMVSSLSFRLPRPMPRVPIISSFSAVEFCHIALLQERRLKRRQSAGCPLLRAPKMPGPPPLRPSAVLLRAQAGLGPDLRISSTRGRWKSEIR